MRLLAFEISLVLLLALPDLLPCRNSTASQLDHQADMLLRWKSSLNYTDGCLISWDKYTGPCNWTGVTCSAITVPHGHGPSNAIQVVTNICLPECSLEGTLHHLNFADFSELSVLDLSNNMLYGSIPASIGNLTKLTHLDLSSNSNYYDSWGLDGQIPATLGMLENLQTLNLGHNSFTGPIPSSLGNLTKLDQLNLGSNSLSYHIPQELEMIRSLKFLDLSNNNIKGSIPGSIGNLTRLESLDLSSNRITGSIPPSIGNLARLESLDLSSNEITGYISPSIGNIARLKSLDLSSNQIIGSIPPSIRNLASLESLDLSSNQIIGSIPPSIGNLARLKYFKVRNNEITSSIPGSIGNLISLEVLDLSRNEITGSIPGSIGNLTMLNLLDLSSNKIISSIPRSIGSLMSLDTLDLSTNEINGFIPRCIENLMQLEFLNLSSNKIIGSIPGSIGNLPRLALLDLSSNQINGCIPSTIWKLASLTKIALQSNQMNCLLSVESGSLFDLSYLDLSSNQFTGSIPTLEGKCWSLSILRMSDNLFTGPIPQEISNCFELYEMDLSRNNLSGAIPMIFEKLYHLRILNLSFNSLSGRLEESFAPLVNTNISLDHNMDICGDPKYGLEPCDATDLDKKIKEGKTNKHHVIALLLAFGFFCFVCLATACMAVIYRRRKFSKVDSKNKSQDMVSIWNFDGKIAFQDIIDATECFDEKYCIGVGGYGSVFRAELKGGSVYAVKLLHSIEDYTDEKGFHAEIEALTKVRHRCIVKLHGYCSHSKCKFLVYDLIERGSLASHLQEEQLAKDLDWSKRIAIVKDVSQAFSYLHHDCDVPIIHRDIKSSNILLDLDFKAYVSDFGMAKKLKHTCSSWSTIFAGTCGYIAPVLALSPLKWLWVSTLEICCFRSSAEQSSIHSSRIYWTSASEHQQATWRKTSFCSFWWPLLACKSAPRPGQQCSRYIKHSQTRGAQQTSRSPFTKSDYRICMTSAAP